MTNPFKEKMSVFNPACIRMWKEMAEEMAKELDEEKAKEAMSDFERATGIKIEYKDGE